MKEKLFKIIATIVPVVLGPFLFKWAGFNRGADWDNPCPYLIIICYVIGSIKISKRLISAFGLEVLTVNGVSASGSVPNNRH